MMQVMGQCEYVMSCMINVGARCQGCVEVGSELVGGSDGVSRLDLSWLVVAMDSVF